MNKIVYIIAALIFLMSPRAARGGQTELIGSVRLHHQAIAGGETIGLKEIADISAASEDYRQKLENIKIRVTAVDESGEMAVGYFEIRKALADAEIPPVQIDIYGAMTCRITAAGGKEIKKSKVENPIPLNIDKPADEIQTAGDGGTETLEKALKGRLDQLLEHEGKQTAVAWRCERGDILNQPASKYVITPKGAMGLGRVCFEVQESGSADKVGETSHPARITRIYGQIELICESVVAARAIRAGEVIGENDVQMAVRRVDSLRDRGLSDKAMVVGQETAVPIAEQQVIQPAMVKKYMVIKRNDAVEITSRVGQIQVTMPGTATEAGGMGDVIMVRGESKKSLLHVRIIEAGKVTVISDGDGSSPVAAVSQAKGAKIN
jgi:flagella basal body P-ring formation protein FlgA